MRKMKTWANTIWPNICIKLKLDSLIFEFPIIVQQIEIYIFVLVIVSIFIMP